MVDIEVELFSVPRLRAGAHRVSLRVATVREALLALHQCYPGLQGLISATGEPSDALLISLNGDCFLTDLNIPLVADSRLLILSADAGG